ncbi:hypothetical protein K2227_03830 [Shewanella putrefaciens]|nr:hypothetical protein K2227_03830 [Shewanella putrefaciens]
MFILTHSKPNMAPFNVARLELDLDPLAERYIVADRKSGSVLVSQRVDKNTLICPLKYTNSRDLFVVMFDDDRFYNAVIVDGVKPELIEAVTAGL